MKPINHVSVSIITGVVTYVSTGAISPSIACFLVGWLVDVDHIWDYYKNAGRDFSIKRFMNTFENNEIKKVYLYFHSYELLFVLTVSCFISHFNYLLSFTTMGFAIHLFFDQIFNSAKPCAYFITFRILQGYRTENIFKPKYHDAVITEEHTTQG